MFVDGQTLPDGHLVQTDLCIVGAGVAGISLAKECIGAPFDVCLVESGGDASNRHAQSLNRGESVGYPYWSLSDVRRRQFGGTAHTWRLPFGSEGRLGLKLRPLDEIDFEQRSWLPLSGWPISRRDLVPYYESAQEHFGLGPAHYDGAYWEDKTTAPRLSLDHERVRTIVLQYADRDVYTKVHRETIARANNVTTLLNSTVLEIETDVNAKAARSLRIAKPDGGTFRVSAKAFVIAAGGLETPRLLLLSTGVQRNGLGNDRDVVGRYFMEHPHFLSGRFVPSDDTLFGRARLYSKHTVGNSVVMASLSLSEQITRSASLLNFCATLGPSATRRHDVHHSRGFASLREVRSFLNQGHPPENAGRHLVNVFGDLPVLAAHAMTKAADVVRTKIGRPARPVVFDLYHMSEQTPNPDSRVTLSSSRDRFGQPRVKLDWRLTEADISTVLRGQEIMDAELRRAGLGHIEPERYDELPPPGIRGGYHHMGTTRMSTDPGVGVVDEACRIHGIDNLFVAGSSVFPTSGFANPTLTIVALAIRLADQLKAELRR